MPTDDQQPVRLDELISYVVNQHPGGDALEHLADAVLTSQHLGEVSDHLIGHFVDQARRSGASWTDIGQYMGVTKQAVQKRFVPRESEDLDFPTTGRLSRFTQRARAVLQRAKAEAESRSHDQVTDTHVLLGLLAEREGLAARAILTSGLSLEQVQAAAEAALPKPGRRAPRSVHFSREAKKTLELSLRAALRLGHNYIGTEHILLGILANDDDSAAQVLTGLGITRESAEAWVITELEALQAERA
jgi:hypothetical protein